MNPLSDYYFNVFLPDVDYQNKYQVYQEAHLAFNDLLEEESPNYNQLEYYVRVQNNAIAEVGQGVISWVEWNYLCKHTTAAEFTQQLVNLKCTNESYRQFFNWFHTAINANNKHNLVVNRIFAAKFPDQLSSTSNIATYTIIENRIMEIDHGVHIEHDNQQTWLERNKNLTHLIKHRIFGEYNKEDVNQLNANYLPWFVYTHTNN